ncbi:MAG: hypothetical protein KKG14_10415 [Alphaproteobacteria bacterium]|nr:hypothetical protein [Alphaproteobacteria bacterium]MBU2271985.1 hypothetical protein [Alphaproteobacteria bacterium]MBU2419102.1 hypothetical protein [Alphaproteobacteria bacterium]
MWFGLPAEVAVRCGHCGEGDWRTPVELKSGCLVCFMCGQVTLVPAAAPAQAENRPPAAAAAAAETVRRLAIHQPPPRPSVGGAGAPPLQADSPDAAGPPPFGLSLVPNGDMSDPKLTPG